MGDSNRLNLKPAPDRQLDALVQDAVMSQAATAEEIVHILNNQKEIKMSGTSRSAAQCETVAGIISGRSDTHGDAFENLQDIAERWTSLFSYDFDIATVATAMIEVKLSRMAHGDCEEIDHFHDIMGYAAIAAAWIDKKKEDKEQISPDPRGLGL